MTIPFIDSIDAEDFSKKLQQALDQKTKPIGSLGQLEAVAIQLGMIQKSMTPTILSPQMIVFVGDHGIVKHGVSLYPQEVTWQMVQNFLSGGAAISVLARQHQMGLTVVDCGVKQNFEDHPQLLKRKIREGTRDILEEPAMTRKECDQAIQNGIDLVRNLSGNLLALGEMGIGNTSSATLLISRLMGVPIEKCTGAGTGLDSQGVIRKTEILRKALEKHPTQNPLEALACLGGYEIATMVGAILQGAAERRVILVDGFITTAAVCVAREMDSKIMGYCLFSHCSQEQAHREILSKLQVKPLLDLGLRLGEGSGAALAYPLVESAARILSEMANFESAKVSQKSI